MQSKIQNTLQFKDDTEKLNLQLDKTSRILNLQASHCRWLPDLHSIKHIDEWKVGSTCSLRKPSGRVGYIMSEVRERFWMPKLRQPTKDVIHKCYRCKRFQAVASQAPAVGDQLHGRKSGSRQFQVIGVDFAESLIYIKREARRKSPHRCVKLQFNTSSIHGPHERSKPWRIPYNDSFLVG